VTLIKLLLWIRHLTFLIPITSLGTYENPPIPQQLLSHEASTECTVNKESSSECSLAVNDAPRMRPCTCLVKDSSPMTLKNGLCLHLCIPNPRQIKWLKTKRGYHVTCLIETKITSIGEDAENNHCCWDHPLLQALRKIMWQAILEIEDAHIH
jgi:hypothetical protein